MSLKSPDATLRIAYVTRGRADDYSNWSGIVRHIRDGLTSDGHEVHTVDNIEIPVPLVTRIWARYVRLMSGKRYAYDRDRWSSQAFANQVDKKLKPLNVDCVVCPVLQTPAFLKTHLPVAVWDDGPFHCLREMYPQYREVAPQCIVDGDRIDRLAVNKASILAFASHWAAEDALRYHQADPGKVVVVPFGANADTPFTAAEDVLANHRRKATEKLRLLFVGIDWERKGGPLAVSILQELQRRGVPSELMVIGCDPFGGAPPTGVRCLGRLNKADPAQAALWRQSFLDAHVFVMPTRAECFGVVYAEAAAHGLPSLGTRVGGVPDAVMPGESGWLFDLKASASEYCDVLQSLLSQPQSLLDASLSAYRYYRSKLNWSQSIQTFVGAIQQRLAI
jgi:glycosyltransferase involved in cell wall biosynthesis